MFAALTEAAREGDVKHVQCLIHANPLLIDTRSQPGDWTPSLLAAYYNQPECVELFISKGANVNHRDDDGHLRRGVLHWMAGHGRALTVLKLAKEYGADPNLLDANAHTPLHRACIENHPLTVLVLLLVGANPLLCTEEGQLPSQLTDSALAHFFLLLGEKRCKALSSAAKGDRDLPSWEGGKEQEIDTEIILMQKNGGGGYQNEGASESPSTGSTTNSSVGSSWQDEENNVNEAGEESKFVEVKAESEADVEDSVDEESLLLVAAEAGKKDSRRRRRREKGQQQQQQQLKEPLSSLSSSSSSKAQVYSIVV